MKTLTHNKIEVSDFNMMLFKKRKVTHAKKEISNKDKNKDKEYYSKILEEYRNNRSEYEDFNLIVFKILDSLLKNGNYKYHILYRTKTLDSLKEKIIRKNVEGKKYPSLDQIDDLAGIRIIFYFEKDKKAFIDEIQKELSGSVLVKNKQKENGYNATHLILSLGERRTELGEYKRFKGFRSEVQITSIFYHAWAEIEHDLVYKDTQGLKHVNPKKFHLIKDKLALILEKYIKQA